MLNSGRPFTFDRVVRLILGVGMIILLIWVFGYLSDVLIPFAAALLLAYYINPLVALVQRWIKIRVAAVLLCLIVLLAALITVLALVIPVIVDEVGRMGGLLADLAADSDLARRVAGLLPEDIWQTFREFISRPEIKDLFRPENLINTLVGFGEQILPGVWSLITGTISVLVGLLGLVVVALYVVFLLMDFRKVAQTWQNLLPPQYRAPIVDFLEDVDEGMRRHFRGQSTIALIVAVLAMTAFRLTGLPLGMLVGLFIGVLTFVPYLNIIGYLFALFLSLFQALEMGTTVWAPLGMTAGVIVVLQGLQDALLTPRIQGKATGLSPAIILLALSIWGKLLGLFGLLIALPMTCILFAYYKRFVILPARDPALEAGERAQGDPDDQPVARPDERD